jgi:hypothetical protein
VLLSSFTFEVVIQMVSTSSTKSCVDSCVLDYCLWWFEFNCYIISFVKLLHICLFCALELDFGPFNPSGFTPFGLTFRVCF